MNKNMFQIYKETTQKQIKALEEGMELLMFAEPSTAPAVDVSELEKALQQEQKLRAEVESSKEDIKRRFKAAFEQEQELRVKAESDAAEFKRKFEEAMADLTKEREAREADKIKWIAEIDRSMKKDDQIEDLQETIEELRVQLAAKPKEIVKEVVKEVVVENRVKRTPDVRKDDQAIKANIKQQLTAIEEQEVPGVPAQNNIPSVEEDEVPDMNTWVHPAPKFKLFVTFQKNCADCPLVSTCDYQSKKKSEFGTDCVHLSVKDAAIAAKELHVKVSTKGNKYMYPAFTKEGVYVGDVHKNRENKKIIAALQNYEGKTVVLGTTPDKVVKDSVFTRYEAEILDVIDNVDEPSVDTPPADTSNAVDASDLVFEDMSGNENNNEEETTEEILNGLMDLGEPIDALF